ncbi:reverse transcriptase [Senna tora]|uniref:Reverse transcriptase n=1 Tax=Senna tora TaxID=362788 RepID=A0A834T537_9FABA|nr:reverse transcriptase [Senna tora]
MRVNEEVIRKAAFDLGALKAPGPDGFSEKFYHSSWSIVGSKLLSLSWISSMVVIERYSPKYCFKQQKDFIKGRLIQDNIVIDHEVYHYLKNRASSGRFELAMKIVMAKSYDRVEWDFLELVLFKLGFFEGWVNWVKFVGSVKVAEVNPGRGLSEWGEVGMSLSCSYTLFFTDDSLLFLNASKGNCEEDVCGILGISSSNNPERYLGLPTLWKRSKKALSFVKDKMLKKIQSWKQSTLSHAGKEVMVKSVAVVVPDFGGEEVRENTLASLGVIKGIYFPNSDFMLARKGSRASWRWYSILEGREALSLGLGWRVGSREKKVSSIIVNGRWDLGDMEEILRDEEVEAIESIPISIDSLEDKRV